MWGLENWGEMVWGSPAAVPLLGPVGIAALISSFLLGAYLVKNRKRFRSFATLVAVVLLVLPMAAIATISLPHVFTNGTVADADEVNANLDALAVAASHRTIPRAFGNGPVDGTDIGPLASRVLNIDKALADTTLRIGYTDNFRAYRSAPPAACRWEVRIDGVSCPSGALIYDEYMTTSSVFTHRAKSVVGYCDGLAAGLHTIQVYVSNHPSGPGSDCYTGFDSSTWVIESEEVY